MNNVEQTPQGNLAPGQDGSGVPTLPKQNKRARALAMLSPEAKKRAREMREHKQRAAIKRFLEAYAQCGNLTTAAKVAKVHRSTHNGWMKTVQEYPALFNAARDQAVEVLEAEARRRAVEGIDEPVYQKGEQVGTVRKYSDVLLIFLLKGARPDVYRDSYTKHEHTGSIKLEALVQGALNKSRERERARVGNVGNGVPMIEGRAKVGEARRARADGGQDGTPGESATRPPVPPEVSGALGLKGSSDKPPHDDPPSPDQDQKEPLKEV
jgi:hypothetical protein